MNRLKDLRKEKGLSQKAFSEEIGVSYRTIQNWENGESQIKPDKAQQLADYFGVEVGYLLGYDSFENLLKLENKTGLDYAHSIGMERLKRYWGDNVSDFLKNAADKTTNVGGKKAEVNLIAAIGLLPDEFVQLIFYYSILSIENAETIWKFLIFMAQESIENNDS